LTSAVVCEKSYYKGKGKNNDIDFSGLAEHAFCFNSISNRFARFWCNSEQYVKAPRIVNRMEAIKTRAAPYLMSFSGSLLSVMFRSLFLTGRRTSNRANLRDKVV
jgi:hypothetical protein